MSTLISTLLILGTILLIGYPLIKGVREQDEPLPAVYDKLNERDVVMSALGEIEFDYQMKKLSEEDYKSLKHSYSGLAVKILKKEEDRLGVEAKTLSVSSKLLAQLEQEIEQELKRLENKENKPVCSVCGEPLMEVGQTYCHTCGERQQ